MTDLNKNKFVDFIKRRCHTLKRVGACCNCPNGINYILICDTFKIAEQDYYGDKFND